MATTSEKDLMDGSKEHPIMYFDSNGHGPFYHVCGDGMQLAGSSRVRVWLDRQILIGVTREERDIVERLIDDLESGY